jgi:hypothetical protein
MEQQDYEILPHQLLSDLKYDVEALKKKLSQPDTKMQELILEIESMKDSIHELNTVFKQAIEETKVEDPHQDIKTMREKMETVLSQNETIARGMVAISDKLEDFMGHTPKSAINQPPGLAKGIVAEIPAMAQSVPSNPGMPVHHTMGPPQMPGSRVAPPFGMDEKPPSLGEPSMDFPPPPPGDGGMKKKRVGLFK